MNKAFFSLAILMGGLISNTVACEPMDPNGVYKFKECLEKVEKTFLKRINYFKPGSEEEKATLIEDITEMAEYEKGQCHKTCVDAPKPDLGS
ncbi:MAG: hypothetical protein K0M45_04455 [Candidatus Paracaedibacteraceae bacterium]|nr:hypothetical protein [Candidatus Paracaedibacteraceae bacterium]